MWTRDRRARAVRIFLRRLGILALGVLVVTVGSGVWQLYWKERESAGLRAQAETNRDELAARRAKLEADIAMLQTDRGKEEVLREQYALAEKGEKLIVIVDRSTTTPIRATSTMLESIRRFFWPW